MRMIEENYTAKSNLYITTIKDFCVNRASYKVNEYIQREVICDTILGGDGHDWQRDLIASLIMDASLPPLFISDNPNDKDDIDDGQQRSNSIWQFNEGNIRLPRDMGAKYGDEYDYLSNCSFMELEKISPDLREKFLNKKLLIEKSFGKSEKEKSESFIAWNNGTPLANQEKRAAQYSFGARYLHNLTEGLKISARTKVKDKRRYSVLGGVEVTGKSLQEIIAYWYDHFLSNKIVPMTTSALDKRYKWFLDQGITPSKNILKKNKEFETTVSFIDDSIFSYGKISNKNSNFFGKRELRFYFPVISKLLAQNYKLDKTKIVSQYETALAILSEKNELWTHPTRFRKDRSGNKLPLQMFWDELFGRRADDVPQVTFVVDTIVDTMIQKFKYTAIHPRREFTRKQKLVAYNNQDGKCYYCGDEVEFENCIGDHIIPHSKGGETEPENCAISCKDCNAEKSSLDGKEYEMVLSSRQTKKQKESV